MAKEWTVDQPVDEWKAVEWIDHFDPEVRPKFTNYWLAYGEALWLKQASVRPEDYYSKRDQWGRCERAS
jgi:hypothetical protein